MVLKNVRLSETQNWSTSFNLNTGKAFHNQGISLNFSSDVKCPDTVIIHLHAKVS